MIIALSARLFQVAEFVPVGMSVADIGTDHGLLPLYLIDSGRSSRIVGGDINLGPYHIARRAIQARGLEQNIDLRLGNGLEILKPGEVDVVVLAGMGGRTVCGILAAGQSLLPSLKRLVIQPMRDIATVRKWLWQHGWGLADEELVQEDGHFYVILAAEPGCRQLDDEFILETGPLLLEKRGQLLHQYLTARQRQLATIRERLQASSSSPSREKLAAVQLEMGKIKEVLQDW